MFHMIYPFGSVPQFRTNSHNYIISLAEIWDVVHSDDSWIDMRFFVDGELFKSREDYREFYKEQHQKYVNK